MNRELDTNIGQCRTEQIVWVARDRLCPEAVASTRGLQQSWIVIASLFSQESEGGKLPFFHL